MSRAVPFLSSVLSALAITASTYADPVDWTGAVSESWDEAGNWSSSEVPTAAETVIIGAVPTLETGIEMSQPSYTLTGIDFQGSGGYYILGTNTPTITLTGGTLSSTGDDDTVNLIIASVALTAADNTITVTGGNHELDLDDVTVTGSLTTNVDASLCLGGTTTISGAFIKTGIGETCTANGFTATSTTIQNGLFNVEGSASLGNVVIERDGSMIVFSPETTSAGSVAVSGVLAVSPYYEDIGTIEASDGVTIKHGGSITGVGKIAGDLTVEAGGSISPFGLMGGPLTIDGNLVLELNSIAMFSIAGENVLFGSLLVTGDLTLSGLLSLCDCTEEGLYTLINFDGTRIGTFAGIEDAPSGYNYDLIYNGNTVQLQVTAVPEPAVLGTAALAGAVVLFARMRRVAC